LEHVLESVESMVLTVLGVPVSPETGYDKDIREARRGLLGVGVVVTGGCGIVAVITGSCGVVVVISRGVVVVISREVVVLVIDC
jgi:hypothetical protein